MVNMATANIQAHPAKDLDISVVVPFLNEAENLEDFFKELNEVLQKLGKSYEIIFIDDGSTDLGHEILTGIAHKDAHVKIIRFTRNFGQTAAMAAGFKAARGQVYVTMDADRQNDPQDIPKLLDKMREGYGVVSGWRKDRRDTLLTRKIPSFLANWLISAVTRVKLKDYGCTLKAYEARFIELVTLYGEMHRFIPAFAALSGARITELPVHHRARTRGKSKYGLSRTFKVLLDLLTVKFLGSFATKPIYFFGGFGVILNIAAFILAGLVLYQKYASEVFAHRNPLLLLAVFLSVLGFIMIMMGLNAELLMRTYHESQNKTPYVVRDMVNLE